MKQLSTLVLMCILGISSSFPPQPIFSEPRTKSHRDIIEEGMYRAASVILRMKGFSTHLADPHDIVKGYFGNDNNGFRNFLAAINEIVMSCNYIQRKTTTVAFYSVNGEQIETAHAYLQRRYKDIVKLTSTANFDVPYVRQKIGEYLYTLQEFYSNTNWVEMHKREHRSHAVINSNFGVPGHSVGFKIDLEANTCISCSTARSLTGCENNIMHANKLTSGYRSGQDVIKPSRTFDSRSGKCSHGGRYDMSSRIPAKGGINKERYNADYSPHFNLHEIAAEYAVVATTHFISDKETGLASQIDLEKLSKILSLKSYETLTKASLAFCIDTTGSMSDDIHAAIATSKKIVSSAAGSPLAPENYVLVTFNDPEYLTTHFVTDNGYALVNELEKLTANGGGDCPEYSFSGIITAIRNSLPGSIVYIFTDADAKDSSRIAEVIQDAIAKEIKLTFILTGTCSRRKRFVATHTGRSTRSTSALYDQIAQQTGGEVHRTTKSEIADVVEKVVAKNLPSAEILAYVLYMNSSTDESIFEVERNLSILQVRIEGLQTNTGVALIKPDGTLTDISAGKASFFYIVKDNIGIFSIADPELGQWQIRKRLYNVGKPMYANITIQSVLSFTTTILTTDEDGLRFSLRENPIAGRRYDVVTSVLHLKNGTIHTVLFRDKIMETVTECEDLKPFSEPELDISSRFVCNAEFSLETDYIQISGVDENNNTFTRLNILKIAPANAKLDIDFTTDELTVHLPHNVSYTITNLGHTNQSFVVNINVSNGQIIGDRRENYWLLPEEKMDGIFTIEPVSDEKLLVYDLAVQNKYAQIIQQTKRTFTVTKKLHPHCEISTMSVICPPESLNTESCSSYDWKAWSSITFKGVNLTEFVPSAIVNITSYETSITETNVNISGSCCIPIVNLDVHDNEGFFDTCVFDMSNGQAIASVKSVVTTVLIPSTEFEIRKSESHGLYIGLGSGGGVFLILIFIIALLLKKRHQKPSDT